MLTVQETKRLVRPTKFLPNRPSALTSGTKPYSSTRADGAAYNEQRYLTGLLLGFTVLLIVPALLLLLSLILGLIVDKLQLVAAIGCVIGGLPPVCSNNSSNRCARIRLGTNICSSEPTR